MLSWITGPRGGNAQEQELDPNSDTTYIEPPETPAPVFAVRAFKHALFGTPAPPETIKRMEKQKEQDITTTKTTEFAVKKESAPQFSPSKPNGILMTPGTAARNRKTVTFGSHVVDNEGKRGQIGKSGIPNDCPGKFPSPWTPGTELRADPNSDKKPRTKLTEALYDARSTKTTTTLPPSSTKGKSKDGIDLTLDMSAPRSESGKYWKEQYESYSAKTSEQMKKLVAKQKLAKTYAKKKDSEAMELATRLQEERKRFRLRELELEAQTKEYQERLRQAMAENSRAAMEMAALKKRVEAIEAGSEIKETEDRHEKKDKTTDPFESLPSTILGKPMPSPHKPATGKENSPPKSRHVHRSPRDTTANAILFNLDTASASGPGSISSLPTKSPLSRFESQHRTPLTARSARSKQTENANQSTLLSLKVTSENQAKPTHTPPASKYADPEKEKQNERAGSPDPWLQDLDVASSPFPEPYNRMALPISSAPASVHAKSARPAAAKPTKMLLSQTSLKNTTSTATNGNTFAGWNTVNPPSTTSTDGKDDVGGHAGDKTDGPSAFVLERERSKLPVDRKADAKKRLALKKKMRERG